MRLPEGRDAAKILATWCYSNRLDPDSPTVTGITSWACDRFDDGHDPPSLLFYPQELPTPATIDAVAYSHFAGAYGVSRMSLWAWLRRRSSVSKTPAFHNFRREQARQARANFHLDGYHRLLKLLGSTEAVDHELAKWMAFRPGKSRAQAILSVLELRQQEAINRKTKR